jgi:hypothetical protein
MPNFFKFASYFYGLQILEKYMVDCSQMSNIIYNPVSPICPRVPFIQSTRSSAPPVHPLLAASDQGVSAMHAHALQSRLLRASSGFCRAFPASRSPRTAERACCRGQTGRGREGWLAASGRLKASATRTLMDGCAHAD